jgi:ribonuclease R
MQDKLGEEFTGVITGVTTFGIFVQLDQLYVEGLVHVTELGTDYFQYDDARHELRGERSGKRYQLTDRVSVQVVRVDLESRKIDLRLAGAEAADGQSDEAGKSGKSGKSNKSNSGNAPAMVKPGPKTQSRFDAKAGSGKPRHGSAGPGTGASKPVSKSGKKKR